MKKNFRFFDNRHSGFGINNKVLPVNFALNFPQINQKRVFTTVGYGSFLSFIYPELRAYTNGFVIDTDFMKNYLDVIQAKNIELVEKVFQQNKIDLIVLPHQPFGLYNYLNKQETWKKIYRDHLITVYKRKTNN